MAKTAVSIDFTWTCEDGANPNLHHLETVPLDDSGGRDEDAWFSYRATGLKLKVAVEISRGETEGKELKEAGDGVDSSSGEESELRVSQGGWEYSSAQRSRCSESDGIGGRWGVGRGFDGIEGGRDVSGPVKKWSYLAGKLINESRATSVGLSEEGVFGSEGFSKNLDHSNGKHDITSNGYSSAQDERLGEDTPEFPFSGKCSRASTSTGDISCMNRGAIRPAPSFLSRSSDSETVGSTGREELTTVNNQVSYPSRMWVIVRGVLPAGDPIFKRTPLPLFFNSN